VTWVYELCCPLAVHTWCSRYGERCHDVCSSSCSDWPPHCQFCLSSTHTGIGPFFLSHSGFGQVPIATGGSQNPLNREPRSNLSNVEEKLVNQAEEVCEQCEQFDCCNTRLTETVGILLIPDLTIQ